MRRFPWWVLVVAFVVVPLAEIYVLIQVGQVIGAWWTLLLLVADGFFGGWLIKHEGARAWRALTLALSEHRMPHRELADGALVLIGGTLMVTPGFLSDVAGLLCILPWTRPLARAALAGVVRRRLLGGDEAHGSSGQPTGRPDGRSEHRTRRRPGPDVVQGEVVEDWKGDD